MEDIIQLALKIVMNGGKSAMFVRNLLQAENATNVECLIDISIDN